MKIICERKKLGIELPNVRLLEKAVFWLRLKRNL